MDTQQLAADETGALPVPPDELFRVPTPVYRGMVRHGLITEADGVELHDGRLVVRGADGSPADRLYRLTPEVYEGISRLGLLGRHDRKVELLDGLLVSKMTRYPPHIVAVNLTEDAVNRVLPAGWFTLKEDPVFLPTGPAGHASMPEPDVSVIRGAVRDYIARRPGPGDIALVIEVSESSLRRDRVKLARYAWANIPSAWIVNLNNQTIESYTRPSGPTRPAGYAESRVFGAADEVPVVVDGREAGRVAARDLLP